MILKRRVALGGVQLDELDNRILITGIDEAAGKDNITAVGSAAGNGQRITGRRRDTLDITIKFALNIRSDDMAGREELLEKIIGWASGGGWLTIGSRPNRRLMVTLSQAPGSGDMFSWANDFTMVFRAYSVPFWMDREASVFTGSTVKSGSFDIEVPGNTETVADVTVENKSGKTISNVTVKVGGSQMIFASLALGGTATLTVDHVHTNEKFYLRARAGGSSMMKYRTPESADDFKVSPGKNTVTFSAERAVKVTVSVRGRYL